VEHVSFQAFVQKFSLCDREAAMEAYYTLLECSAIQNKRQHALKESFDQFRLHHEERFWTKRALDVNTEVLANRAGLKVHEAGEATSSAAIDSFLSTIHDTRKGLFTLTCYLVTWNVVNSYCFSMGVISC
jgi:hypothetical protein